MARAAGLQPATGWALLVITAVAAAAGFAQTSCAPSDANCLYLNFVNTTNGSADPFLQGVAYFAELKATDNTVQSLSVSQTIMFPTGYHVNSTSDMISNVQLSGHLLGASALFISTSAGETCTSIFGVPNTQHSLNVTFSFSSSIEISLTSIPGIADSDLAAGGVAAAVIELEAFVTLVPTGSSTGTAMPDGVLGRDLTAVFGGAWYATSTVDSSASSVSIAQLSDYDFAPSYALTLTVPQSGTLLCSSLADIQADLATVSSQWTLQTLNATSPGTKRAVEALQQAVDERAARGADGSGSNGDDGDDSTLGIYVRNANYLVVAVSLGNNVYRLLDVHLILYNSTNPTSTNWTDAGTGNMDTTVYLNVYASADLASGSSSSGSSNSSSVPSLLPPVDNLLKYGGALIVWSVFNIFFFFSIQAYLEYQDQVEIYQEIPGSDGPVSNNQRQQQQQRISRANSQRTHYDEEIAITDASSDLATANSNSNASEDQRPPQVARRTSRRINMGLPTVAMNADGDVIDTIEVLEPRMAPLRVHVPSILFALTRPIVIVPLYVVGLAVPLSACVVIMSLLMVIFETWMRAQMRAPMRVVRGAGKTEPSIERPFLQLIASFITVLLSLALLAVGVFILVVIGLCQDSSISSQMGSVCIAYTTVMTTPTIFVSIADLLLYIALVVGAEATFFIVNASYYWRASVRVHDLRKRQDLGVALKPVGGSRSQSQTSLGGNGNGRQTSSVVAINRQRSNASNGSGNRLNRQGTNSDMPQSAVPRTAVTRTTSTATAPAGPPQNTTIVTPAPARQEPLPEYDDHAVEVEDELPRYDDGMGSWHEDVLAATSYNN